MHQLTPHSLWLGHAGDLSNVSQVLAIGIEAVLELADSEPPAKLPREIIHLRIPLSDGGDNPPVRLHLAVESVTTLLQNRIFTLVACSAGMSRSVAVTAAALARVEGKAVQEILARISKNHPIDVSPLLLKQMLDGTCPVC
jgi:protein-tyrosine phosphatase